MSIKKILILTVGGSCAPIVTSIQQNKPDYLVFICSADGKTKGSYITVEGQGNVCGKDANNPDQPNILKQAKCENLPREVHKLGIIDNFNEMYQFCLKKLLELRQKYPEAEIIADYTGGTKTMSVGLGAAAMDVENVAISIVKGERTDLVKVLDGTQSVRLSRLNVGFLNRQKAVAEKFIAQYDYAAAMNLLNEIAAMPDLPDELSQEFTRLNTLCKAFDAWDKFNHLEAYRLLKAFGGDYLPFLKVSIQSRALLDHELKIENLQDFNPIRNSHGYELVEDLLLNVERRACAGRYDDAVARLYRAFELFAQLRLRIQFDLKTSDIDLNKLPDEIREEYKQKRNSQGKIELGATQSYALLDKLGDSIGKDYNNVKNKLLNQGLSVRNLSILAHGFKPISEEEYERVSNVLGEFIAQSLKKIMGDKKSFKKQFPSSFSLMS